MANSYYATVHARFYNPHVRDAWLRQQAKLPHVDCVSDRYEKDYLYQIQNARIALKDLARALQSCDPLTHKRALENHEEEIKLANPTNTQG